MKNAQLADLLRPTTIDDIVGQDHLFGPKGVIRRMLESGRMTNMIFFGPPGTGKTTAATILANASGMVFRKLNATTASLSDVKAVVEETGNLFGAGGILLYLDEIQYFNRRQQQSLLEYVEDGRVTLIASTADNPYYVLYNALLSRASVFEFKSVGPQAMFPVLDRAKNYLDGETGRKKAISDAVKYKIAAAAAGDVRHAIILFENAYYASDDEITEAALESFTAGVMSRSDDTHYDLLSCLQKSVRGSDPDAAVFYLAKLLSQGELISACRRLQVMANEDIGLAYPMAAVVTHACCETALRLGMPEAQIPLANAAVLLATAPKSNSANRAIEAAMADVNAGLGLEIPVYLQSPLYKGYQYPHDFPNHYVKQRYLPLDIPADRQYYKFGENKVEQAAAEYWKKIKG